MSHSLIKTCSAWVYYRHTHTAKDVVRKPLFVRGSNKIPIWPDFDPCWVLLRQGKQKEESKCNPVVEYPFKKSHKEPGTLDFRV